jgi:hypothetical protein
VILFSSSQIISQKVINKEFSVNGNIHLTPDINIPKVNPGYTLWLPETGNARGLIVFTHPRRDTIQSEFMIDYALSKNLAVLYTTTENRLEFFFEPSKMQEIENYICEVISLCQIPEENLLYCGMSLEGTRAIKLALYGHHSQATYQITPKAVAICDAPLDMVRFHKSMVKAKKINFNSVTANEGTWVSTYLETNLSGKPNDNLKAYLDYSPYSYLGNNGPKLDHLKNIAIRCYTEPDVQWWIDSRRKDYYDMNAVDMAALINHLKLSGNEKAELVITENKGRLPNGDRHPHSWSIVDEKELIDWFVRLIK